MFPYYAETIFNNEAQKDLYQYYLAFMVSCIGIKQEELQALVEQATDGLCTMFEDEDLKPRLSPFILEILEKLASYITTIKASKFFDIIQHITKTYSALISNHDSLLINLISLLVERAFNEYELVKNQQKSTKLIISKIWHTITAVGENRDYIPKFQERLEKALIPLFNYLDGVQDVFFDDDILQFITSVMKISKSVSSTMWELFRVFPKLFDKYNQRLGDLFPALNCYIVYGREVINNDPNGIRLLIDMGLRALNPGNNDNNEASMSEGALLLHLVIQVLLVYSLR